MPELLVLAVDTDKLDVAQVALPPLLRRLRHPITALTLRAPTGIHTHTRRFLFINRNTDACNKRSRDVHLIRQDIATHEELQTTNSALVVRS